MLPDSSYRDNSLAKGRGREHKRFNTPSIKRVLGVDCTVYANRNYDAVFKGKRDFFDLTLFADVNPLCAKHMQPRSRRESQNARRASA